MDLESIRIQDVIENKQELVQVAADTPIAQCLEVLSKKRILSVPVLERKQNLFIGIVDVFDIMRFTALGFFEDKLYQDKLFEEFTFGDETARKFHIYQNNYKNYNNHQ